MTEVEGEGKWLVFTINCSRFLGKKVGETD